MATNTITVTCRRCGKRHPYELESGEDSNTIKNMGPLCNRCLNRAIENDDFVSPWDGGA